MRTIKFRGKTHITTEWVYGSVVTYNDGAVAMCSSVDGRYEWRYVEPTTVGQYTGMDDDDGKEIYEGDIIKVKDIFGEEFECIVVFDNKYHHGFDIRDKEGFWHSYNDMLQRNVIGNIHDNPELLKEGKQ